MEHKGKAETVEVQTDDYSAGDCVNVTLGDWNGAGFSYKMNGNVKTRVYVVEAHADKLTVVAEADRAEWCGTGDTSREFTISADGMVDGYDINSWNVRVKEAKRVEGLSGYHKVVHGIEKTRNR